MASVWRVVLRPSAINQPVARGQVITVHAEIVNRLDQPVRVANVPVYLGQVIYAQGGTLFSQAFINKGYGGQTPVPALTNAQGVATFTIRFSRWCPTIPSISRPISSSRLRLPLRLFPDPRREVPLMSRSTAVPVHAHPGTARTAPQHRYGGCGRSATLACS